MRGCLGQISRCSLTACPASYIAGQKHAAFVACSAGIVYSTLNSSPWAQLMSPLPVIAPIASVGPGGSIAAAPRETPSQNSSKKISIPAPGFGVAVTVTDTVEPLGTGVPLAGVPTHANAVTSPAGVVPPVPLLSTAPEADGLSTRLALVGSVAVSHAITLARSVDRSGKHMAGWLRTFTSRGQIVEDPHPWSTAKGGASAVLRCYVNLRV